MNRYCPLADTASVARTCCHVWWLPFLSPSLALSLSPLPVCGTDLNVVSGNGGGISVLATSQHALTNVTVLVTDVAVSDNIVTTPGTYRSQ